MVCIYNFFVINWNLVMIENMDIDFCLESLNWCECLSDEVFQGAHDMSLINMVKNIRQLTPYLNKNYLNHKFRSLKEVYEPRYLRESGHFLENDLESELCVYAQVRVSDKCYKNYKYKLKDLKDNPIGPSWLFLDDRIKRSNFIFFIFDKDVRYDSSLCDRAKHWGVKTPSVARKSIFYKDALELEIIEVFDLNILAKRFCP
jgi:hypothetical protein